MRVITSAFLLAALLLIAAPASAGPVTWTLINSNFDDGGTISGSFVYDADTNSFSSIALTSTIGSARTGAQYVQINPCCAGDPPNASFLLFITSATGNLTGTPVFAAELASPMTNAGGVILFDLNAVFFEEVSCVNSACTGPDDPTRLLISGGVASVPEPGTFLVLPPLVAMAVWRVRRRR